MESNSHVADDDPAQQGGLDTVGSTATNVADGFTMVAVGDLIMSRSLTKGHHPGFSEIVEILHEADVTFGNMEANIFDIRSFKGSPQAEHGGPHLTSPPEIGPDLKAMGFNLVSRANNHTLEWGLEGMRETSRLLDENGIVHAGAGENLAQAGAARFLETARGRVALVSFAATHTLMSRACDPAGEAPGRPGLNALRLAVSIVVPHEVLESLKQLRNVLPFEGPSRKDPKRVVFAPDLYHKGVTFETGDKVGYSYEPNPRDVADILRNIRQGKQFSDFCIAASHCHQPGNFAQEPADYEQSFAHQLIDAGADAYVGHGPHQLRGIEIYKGRPIFYSLGNFFYDTLWSPVAADTFEACGKVPRVDTDAEVIINLIDGWVPAVFYESVATVSRFEQNQLAELRLYPIELGFSKRLANRGVPRLAWAAQGRTILERLQKLSKPFGTEIAIKNNIGVIKLKPTSPQ
ncbi:CapA family protein [Sinorhizobium meliloti]|uniref:CapA family protein n=1 Tax=Rhizobium meliloti TaxID=382 RepID=UPI00037E819A|nr:CapA family protein [Sinorhizobium meliloti]